MAVMAGGTRKVSNHVLRQATSRRLTIQHRCRHRAADVRYHESWLLAEGANVLYGTAAFKQICNVAHFQDVSQYKLVG